MFGTRTGLLLKNQHGRCLACGLHFKPGDVMEIDHKFPFHLGGEDRISNLQLLHRQCHDQKTATHDVQLAQEVVAVPMTRAV
jgi:RNA-directed DNA polymerase